VRLKTALLCTSLAVLATTACARSADTVMPDGRHNASTIPHVLRIVQPQDFVTLNPHLYAAASLSMVSELTMAYLVRYDHRGRPYPELAKEIPDKNNGGVSSDGRTITWHLRPNVRWSDGYPFTADDVAFTVRVIQNPDNNELGHDGWEFIDKVETRGNTTVIFHLRRPYASFLPTFFGSAGANPCILPRHILGRLHDINTAPYNSLPVGIGPFRYVRWKRGENVVMERNPYYFKGRPKLDRIEFRTVASDSTAYTEMQTGEADLWPLVPSEIYPRVNAIPRTLTQVIPGSSFSHIDFEVEHAPLRDLVVRQALRLAVDRERIREVVNHGTGVLQEGYAAPGTSGYDAGSAFVRYDPSAANALLDKARWQTGPDGVRERNGQRLSLNMAVAADNLGTRVLIEELRRMWKQIGVELNVNTYPSTLLFNTLKNGGILASGRFDVSEFTWQGDVRGDLSGFFMCKEFPPYGQNYLHYCNHQLDRLYDTMNGSYQDQANKQLLKQIQKVLAEDVPLIVLSINDNIFVQNSDLHNFHPNAYSLFDDIMNVDI
jgi:peptide/nickel transport system substrate-binding protein